MLRRFFVALYNAILDATIWLCRRRAESKEETMNEEEVRRLQTELVGRKLRTIVHGCPCHGLHAAVVLRCGILVEADGKDVPLAIRAAVDFYDDLRLARFSTGPTCPKCGDPSRDALLCSECAQ